MLDENQDVLGSMQVLIREIPVFHRTILYCPRGPIWKESNQEVLKKLVEGIKQLAKQYHAFIFRMDPGISIEDEQFIKMAKQVRLQEKNRIGHNIHKIIQPKFEMQLRLEGRTEEEIFQAFSAKTRHHIRLAQKNKVEIVQRNKEDIVDFYRILEETSKRDDFEIRKLSYYQDVAEKMQHHFRLWLAKVNGENIDGQ